MRVSYGNGAFGLILIMEIYACGINSHGNLSSKLPRKNVTSFQKIAEGEQVKFLGATWCALILEINGELTYRGYHTSGLSNCSIAHQVDVRSAFGDTEGVQGGLSTDGEFLQLAHQDAHLDTLEFCVEGRKGFGRGQSAIQCIALAANGDLAVIIRKQPPVSFCSSLGMETQKKAIA